MRKLILILTAVVFAFSCSSDLEDLNENTKDPATVDGETLFVAAQKRLVDQLTTPNVNLNNNRLWVQHWQETTYPDESNYDQVTRSIPDSHWQILYKDVLNNLKEAARIIEETENDVTNAAKTNKLAVIEMLTVFAYGNLIETYGNIPYTEALDINNTLPVYDDAKTVYLELIERLDAAVSSINSERGFEASDDMIYAGDMDHWRKFANTLKLKMGMVLADDEAGLSQQIVEDAYAAGVFESNEDDAIYRYEASAPNNNPLNDNLVLSGRNDYVAAKTIIDMMNDLEDPRRGYYFDPNLNESIGEVASVTATDDEATITFTSDVSNNPIVGNNVYVESGDSERPTLLGTISAVGSNSIDIEHLNHEPEEGDEVFFAVYEGAVIGEQSRYADFTHANRTMVDPTLPGTILSYIELKFWLAEAAARNYGVGTPQEHYEDGIKASFEMWGTPGVNDYLAKPEVDYDTALASSLASEPWKEVIGTQAWIALYNRSFAPYLSVRRLDFPILVEPARKKSGFPVRYTYPVSEQNLNGSNYGEAANAIGGDVPETLLFWDKEYTFGF